MKTSIFSNRNSFINRSVLLAVALAPLLAGVGFAQTKGGPPARGEAKYDAWLNKEVRHELVMLPQLSVFDNLEYSVNGSEVVLGGQVANATLKDESENVVKHIEGVTKVTNNIEILPLSNNDDRIRRAEYRSIYGDPSLERYAIGSQQPIHIIVNNGHVTLEGFVSTEADKNVAGIRANSVPGVFSVQNHLKFESNK